MHRCVGKINALELQAIPTSSRFYLLSASSSHLRGCNCRHHLNRCRRRFIFFPWFVCVLTWARACLILPKTKKVNSSKEFECVHTPTPYKCVSLTRCASCSYKNFCFYLFLNCDQSGGRERERKVFSIFRPCSVNKMHSKDTNASLVPFSWSRMQRPAHHCHGDIFFYHFRCKHKDKLYRIMRSLCVWMCVDNGWRYGDASTINR